MRRWLHPFCALCLILTAVARPETRAAPQEPSATTTPDAAGVRRQLEDAEKLLRAQQGDRAFPLLETALARAVELSLVPEQAQAHCGIGEVLFYRTQYAKAREHGLAALPLYEGLSAAAGIGRASHLLSMVAELTGDRVEARARAERATAAFESVQDRRGRAIATLQLIRVAALDLAAERTLYARVVADAKAVGDVPLEGGALHSLGDHLFTAGLYEESLDTLTRADAVLSATPDTREIGTVYNSIGRVYRAHGRYDEALRFQLKALALHERANSPFELLQSLNAVATVYQRIGDLRRARAYYERALAVAEKSSSQRVQDLVRGNLASLMLDQGQFARGAAALEQVIANGVDIYPGARYASLSFAYANLSRPSDALTAATRAVATCTQRDDTCINALQRRAAAHTALGEPRAALDDVNAALAGLEAIRARLVPSDFFKQDFTRAQEDVYSQAIALQIQQKQDRLALETAELARARAFLDLLASRDVRLKERDQAQLAQLKIGGDLPARVELQAGAPPSALGLTFRGGSESTTPAVSVPRVSPSELELRSFATAAPSAAEDLIATAARLRSTLMVYWVGEDALFIWVVTPAGAVHTRRVPVLQSRLRELIRETAPFTGVDAPGPGRRAITTRGAETISLQISKATAWRSLYDLLIQPVRGNLPASGSLLTIVPQGPLLNLSFAALQNTLGRYLLEDYALHYAPAGAVLQFTAPKRRADARTGGMLVVADPTLPRLTSLDRPLPRLPGARSEAAAIARLMPAGQVSVLQDATATEARTRESVAGKAVLHFATHAVVSDDDPFGSYLALGPSTTADEANGLLTSREVYGLDLNADLVVLSACRSAGGRVTGDGISAFARAFIYAGTASLVASLWDVADEPTNRLLPDFYRAWLAGESKSRALRGAQLRLLRDLRAGRVRISTPAGVVSVPEHPVFWAGFALFGEPG